MHSHERDQRDHERQPPQHPQQRHRPDRAGLLVVSAIAVVGSVWVGVWPALASRFGRPTTYGASWHWDAAHAVLTFAPGAVGALFGCLVFAEACKASPFRGRASLACAGVVLMACGVWFVLGTFAWPRITGTGGPYALASSTLRLSDDRFGYSVVAGLLLVACGSFVAGWADRHKLLSRAAQRSHRRSTRARREEEGLMAVKPIVLSGD